MNAVLLNRLKKLEKHFNSLGDSPLVFLCEAGSYSEAWAESLSLNHPGRSVFAGPRRYLTAHEWEKAEAVSVPPQRYSSPPPPPQAARVQETQEQAISRQFDELCRLDKINKRREQGRYWK